MVDFTVAKCKTKATYSAKLKSSKKINLGEIVKKFDVVLETPVLVVVKVDDVEVIVHGYGELMFKNCNDVKLMEKISEQIYEVGL